MQSRMDRRTVAKGAGALAGAAAAGLVPEVAEAVVPARQATPEAVAPTPVPEDASLFDRLGGIFPIAAVVNRFSDEIITNPVLNVNPALVAWNADADVRLPGLKFMRTLWIASVAGGPFEYNGLPLSEAHADLNLTAEEFAEVGAEIVRALDFYGVPEREKQELVEAYNASMPEVVSA